MVRYENIFTVRMTSQLAHHFSPESDDGDIGPMMPPPVEEAPKKKKRGKASSISVLNSATLLTMV
jgi:hypothetical protein